MMKRIYPIGAIYTSMNNVNSAIIFGFGTWEQIVDRFLYCANSSGETGGEATHSHTYGMRYFGDYNGELVRGWYPSEHDNRGIQLYGEDGWSYIPTEQQQGVIGVGGYEKNGVATGVTYSGTKNTTSSSSLPPYITVYAYRRIA